MLIEELMRGEGDWNQGDFGLFRQNEGPFLERQQLGFGIPRSFGVHEHFPLKVF